MIQKAQSPIQLLIHLFTSAVHVLQVDIMSDQRASLQSTGGGDGDLRLGGTRVGTVALDLLDKVEALDDLT